MSVEIVRQTSTRRHHNPRRSYSAPVQKLTVSRKNHNENVGKSLRLPCKSVLSRKDYPGAKIISKSEYEYLRACASQGLINEVAKKESLIEHEAKKDQLLAESMARKQKIRQIDIEKLKNKSGKLDEFESEAKARTMHLLERAYNLRLEQEEEMQLCNKLILETKCRAIRDLQVAEKKLIEKELNNEEERLNKIMEEERLRKIKEEKRKEEEEAAKKRAFANLLKSQIIENEEQKIIEFERKLEEGKLINLSNIAWQDEEIAKERKKKERDALIRKELAAENERLMKFKEMEREQNKILDMRIKEYQKMKAERDAAKAEAQRAIQAQKDKERVKLMAQAAQAQDFQAQIEELNAIRVKEEVEREWRRKEKEAAINKLNTQRQFAQAREEQIKNRKIRQAMEIERDKREFEKILAVQKEALAKEKEKQEKQRLEALRYRDEILKQVNKREKEKVEARRKIFEEGMANRAEIEMRAKRLKDAIEKKCEEMRKNKVPEMYINEVKSLINKIN
ncbi:cilia- and flagella-associated protein 45-like [Chelonus insularis]|uniref:cilia- and flagella-associated protein 45-like n=1 Tax=Chelonus insularis TaxID=460826 RepID=UPI00158A88E2|nr:cilia- and flagella-associated protein 45-like [Chelonus insularis]